MTSLHVLRVFVAPDGGHGNPLGVFLDGAAIPADRRQSVARELGFSETVFVDAVNPTGARIAIFTPGAELAFAGHPTVGTSWLLRSTGRTVERLIVPAGLVDTWQEDGLIWIRARAEWVHPMTFVTYEDPGQVDRLTGPPDGEDSYYAWAWIDEASGLLHARYFAAGYGIAEDEATGAAAVVMGDRLGRPLTIRQGAGSELHVRPGAGGTVEVGGRARLVEVRDHAQTWGDSEEGG
jgi:predicted PhzF superfamily epimerase YddE/YHI9